MLALLLQGISKGQQFFFCHAVRADHICHPRLALGNGSGLIQHHRLHPTGLLQGCRRLKQQAIFRAQSAAHHNGHGSSKTQGAGATDDQYRNATGQRIAKTLPQNQPNRHRHRCNGQHRRYKHTGYFIRNLGNRSLGGCRVTDHFDDLGQGSILAHPGSPAFEVTGLIHSGGRNPVSRIFVHRNTLAG